MFQLGEVALDVVSESVDVGVDDRLNLAVSPGRDNGGDVAGFKIGQVEVGVVSLDGEQDAGLGAGLVHQRRIALHIRDLTAAQTNRDRETLSVAAEMDLGQEATARAPKTLVRIPFLSASAACW